MNLVDATQKRLGVQHLISAVILAGSVAAFIAKRDIFPFSDYPMYSQVFAEPEPVTLFRVAGADEIGRDKSILFQQELPPFWTNSFREALLVEPDPDAVQRKLRAALNWYNGRYPDRKLAHLRLYKYSLSWSEFIAEAREFRRSDDFAGQYQTLHVEVEP